MGRLRDTSAAANYLYDTVEVPILTYHRVARMGRLISCPIGSIRRRSSGSSSIRKDTDTRRHWSLKPGKSIPPKGPAYPADGLR